MDEAPKRREFDFVGVGICAIAILYAGLLGPAVMQMFRQPVTKADRAEAVGLGRCHGEEWEAIQAAERAVRRELVSPTSATFPPLESLHAVEGPDCTYEVASDFEAANSLGLRARRRYVARVRPVGEDEWEAVGVAIAE